MKIPEIQLSDKKKKKSPYPGTKKTNKQKHTKICSLSVESYFSQISPIITCITIFATLHKLAKFGTEVYMRM